MTPSLHTRETREAAREVKFVIAPDVATRVLEWSRDRMAPDPHGSGPAGDEYRPTTIYFDTAGFDVYGRRGSYGRSKYRVRRYGASPTIFLERKMRTDEVLNKRRTSVPIEQLPALTSTNLDDEWEGLWFRKRLEARRLLPVCQVSYRRTARVTMGPYGPIRLTLDQDLRAMVATEVAFHSGEGDRVLTERVILEMKFLADMPSLFKQAVEEFALQPSACSKYRTSLDALGGPPRALAHGSEKEEERWQA